MVAVPQITIDPSILFSILDHSLRCASPSAPRVIGTLLGSRSPDSSEIQITSSFAVPHNEFTPEDQVEVDMEYHTEMYSLHRRSNPDAVVVGWYATTSDLNNFSALIQNFYSGQADIPVMSSAVHLTMDTRPEAGMKVNTYVSSSVGVTPEKISEACLFVNVPHEIKYLDGDRAANLQILTATLRQTLQMLERTQNYISTVLSSSEKMASAETKAVGRFLMDTLSLVPSIKTDDVEKSFSKQMEDVLLVGYLGRVLEQQLEVGSQLALVV